MRVLALVLGVSAVVASWYFADELTPELLVFSAYLFSPYALLAFRARILRPLAMGIAIVVVAAMTVSMYETIWTDESSTAALGFVVLPVYQLLAIGAVFLLQELRPGKLKG